MSQISDANLCTGLLLHIIQLSRYISLPVFPGRQLKKGYRHRLIRPILAAVLFTLFPRLLEPPQAHAPLEAYKGVRLHIAFRTHTRSWSTRDTEHNHLSEFKTFLTCLGRFSLCVRNTPKATQPYNISSLP